MIYPETRRSTFSEQLHGTEIPDPYRWLEELDAPETRRWIEAQNRATEAYLEPVAARKWLRERLTELWDYDKYGVPFKRGGRYFYTVQSGLQNQPALYWRPSLADEGRLLLDPNALSADGTVALSGLAVSDDGQHLAYALSSAGSDWMEWKVREVESGQDREDHLHWSKFAGVAWTEDNAGFFYSRYDEPEEGEAYRGANYYQKLFYHQLGNAQDDDEVVYARPDQKEWGFQSKVSEDGRYLIISVWQGTHREQDLYYMDLRAGGPVVELLTGFEAGYQFVGNQGSLFYIYTDLEAPNARLVAIDLEKPERVHWREVIPPTDDALVQVSFVGGHLIAIYLHHAHSKVVVYRQDGSPVRQLSLPGIGSVYGFQGRSDDRETFFQFTSFTTPGSIYRYDVISGEQSAVHRPELTFDPDEYITEQHFYPSKDGTEVPLFTIRRRDVVPGPETPVYQYGYGGFNISLTPQFRVSWLAWAEMGGIVAQPNLRGGGEYGKAWYDAGKLHNKQNVFDDFIAASEWLIAQGYTSRTKLAIGGGSNGGLLVGACLTQRPDLFAACLPAVGVLDMLRFHKFTIGWAWTSDYGSPDKEEDFSVLRAYSPYHNIVPGCAYPATLITTGDHDDRVFPAHSFKFAAALQYAQGGPAPILIRIETRAGHGAGKPTAKIIEETADAWTFLIQVLDVKDDG